MTATPQTEKEFAEYYRCSVRTIARLKAEGIDLGDPVQVARHITTLRAPSIPMLERVVDILSAPEPQN